MPRTLFERRSAPLWVLLASPVIAACGRDRQSIADSSLAGDLALVQSAATVQPLFRDTALTRAPAPRAAVPPRQPTPRPARRRELSAAPRPREQARPVQRRQPRRATQVAEVPPPEDAAPARQPAQPTERTGESAGGRIGAGTVFAAVSNARICTRSNLPGDRISATVNAPVRGANGAEIPAGSKVVLEVASIDASESSGEGQIAFRVHSVAIGDESYPASGAATASGALDRVEGARSASSDKKKVIGGAIAGAILGQVMGKDTRSTVIGAAAGAAAGTAAAKMGDRGEACLAAGNPVRITLEEAVVLH